MACCSTSGRGVDLAGLGGSAAAHQPAPRLQWACRRPGRKAAQQQRAPPPAALGSGKAYNKSRQDLEVEYFKEWEETTVLGAEEAGRPMTAWTLLAALPTIIRFYVVPAPLRFLWFFAWAALLRAAHRLRRAAVLAGAKLDSATVRRQGGAALAGYRMRATALRRLHGKESVLGPLRLLLGR